MEWTKVPPETFVCTLPPDARFTLKASRMPDLRWSWAIHAGQTEGAMVTGISSSLGAAKHMMESFLKKKGCL